MSFLESPEVKTREGEYFQPPATPNLRTIGYGTGVHVYHWDRSAKGGNFCSPWALKKIYKQNCRTSIPKRMEDEANILKKLDHPNIVGFRGYKESKNGQPVLAMEECGISLGEIIEERRENDLGPFEPNIISRVIVSVAEALKYLHHERRIIHGDIKSFNILIKDHFEHIKLCDFGVSFPIEDNDEVEDYIGTLCWSAPEVLKDGPYTPKADIYALGLTIWEMLALMPPHSIDTEDTINESLDNSSLLENDESTYGTRPDLPDNLGEEYNNIVDIFKWCTEPNYLHRPNAMELLGKLTL